MLTGLGGFIGMVTASLCRNPMDILSPLTEKLDCLGGQGTLMCLKVNLHRFAFQVLPGSCLEGSAIAASFFSQCKWLFKLCSTTCHKMVISVHYPIATVDCSVKCYY